MGAPPHRGGHTKSHPHPTLNVKDMELCGSELTCGGLDSYIFQTFKETCINFDFAIFFVYSVAGTFFLLRAQMFP